ncbi:MAG: hypothetical protein Q8Q42_04580 [Nanoarchaeota archaeon]|nr:hypothetical protein [Nanoarchaeota archaeon]
MIFKKKGEQLTLQTIVIFIFIIVAILMAFIFAGDVIQAGQLFLSMFN